MLIRAAIAVLILGQAAGAQVLELERRVSTPADTRGAAFYRQQLYTWGSGAFRWTTDRLVSEKLFDGTFGEGGCLADLDGDGRPEIFLQVGATLGRLTVREAPAWTVEEIDTGIEMHDCIEATLFGRKGLLMVNRGMQVRFYERGPSASKNWPYREIYSFYTASYQAGLVLYDVDRDGLTDILCGNYWIKSPESFDRPWPLYAINTHHKTPEAAIVRFVPTPAGELWMMQSHEVEARLMLFRRPPDPKQLWTETRIGEDHGLTRLHGALAMEKGVLAAENNGAKSRIFHISPAGIKELARGIRAFELFSIGRGRVISSGSDVLAVWRYR